MNVPATSALDSGYLLRNFRQVADWVQTLYADLLNAEESRFYEQFKGLSLPAQHLYVRLLTRTRAIIPVHTLNYVEVPDVTSALAELIDTNYACLNPPADTGLLLETLTKSQLLQWFETGLKPATRKPDCTAAVMAQYSPAAIHGIIESQQPFVQACHQDTFERYLLLFFDNGRQDLSEFVITELGHVRYENYRICRDTRYFNCREDVDILQQYLQVREQLDDPILLQDRDALLACFSHLPDHRQQPELQRRFDHLALTIARQLERLDALEAALVIYQCVNTHPSRERQARILTKLEQPRQALELCRDLIRNSQHPEEQEFAEQFGATLARKYNAEFPALLKPPITIDCIELPFTGDSVEIVAAQALSDDQHLCYYVENTLFCGLFGLLFWDIIFAAVPGAFFHPFQRGPKHLHSEYFYVDRKSMIEARLTEMVQPNWQQRIWQHFESRQGIANPFVVWELMSEELITTALARIPTQDLQFVFQHLAQHPGLFANGFPDLIRFSPQGYELIEVKAPNDRLQPNQRRWFRRFAEAGIRTRLLNVTWAESSHE